MSYLEERDRHTEVRLNGQVVKADIFHEALTKTWVIYINAPELEEAQRLLPVLENAVSLDKAIGSWYARPPS